MNRHESNLEDLTCVLERLKKYLPAQAPLKDFIFQNTLQSFQDDSFHDALRKSSVMFGYKNYLKLDEYRRLYEKGEINDQILNNLLIKQGLGEQLESWKIKLLHQNYPDTIHSRIGVLRDHWKAHFKIDLDSLVHPMLFRVVCSYLDQGVSIWNFPGGHKNFLDSVKELEKNSYSSFFKSKRARDLLLKNRHSINKLLDILVGKPDHYEQYLFDQQFAHPGWSGIVSVIEDNPGTLLDRKTISLKELIEFELLLEIDALDTYFSDIWSPLAHKIRRQLPSVFDDVASNDYFKVLALFQDAYEWSYYEQVLGGIKHSIQSPSSSDKGGSFQAIFCIDDRECSLRRHLEE